MEKGREGGKERGRRRRKKVGEHLSYLRSRLRSTKTRGWTLGR